MTDKPAQAEIETQETRKRHPLYRTLRTLTLASVGAISLSREELKRLLDRLVERGELDAKQARKLFQEADAKRRNRRERVTRKKSAVSSSEVVSMPTRTELEALEKQLARLNAELEELHSLTTASAQRPAD